MDRFPMEVNAANELIVDTGTVIQGPPIGTNTTGQEAEGPNCISGAEEH
jgi:cytochrome b6-f complex iron-sulfur subunit